jgi:hypothetical protein
MHSRSRAFIVVASLIGSMAGCQCNCNSVVNIGGDGGVLPDGGLAGGSGGGSGAGTGGSGGGGANFDAGDGTGMQGFGAGNGSFTLDGGVGGTGTGVKLDPTGAIVLTTGSIDLTSMWIANDVNGWVSKYDTRTGKELGRYYSVVPKDCANSLGPPCAGGVANGLTSVQTHHPSRTAIDLQGNLWVANRALETTGSVTKIANDLSGCVDRNGNGTIETSRDVNGDGQISTNPADGEMIVPTDPNDITKYDECVLFTTPIGGPVNGSVGARALAVAAGIEGGGPGDIWVGIYHQQKMYRLDGNNGQIVPNAAGTTSLDIAFGPYGAIVDRLQRLWVVEPGTAHLALIDTLAGTVLAGGAGVPVIDGTPQGCAAYALGIDGKNRVWVPGWSNGAVACRYDHSTGAWTKFDFSTATSQTGTAFTWGRGIAVNVAGEVFMSGYAGGNAQLIRFDSETGTIIPFGTAQFIEAGDGQTNSSIGVGIDGDGNPWVNNYSGNAMKIDKTSGAVTRTAQQPAGLYTYSDFTGYELRNFTAPRGTYTKDFQGCAAGTTWETLTWDASTPPNTSLAVYVKVGDTVAELNDPNTMRYGPFTTPPVDLTALGIPNNKQLMRVIFELQTSDGVTSPVLRSYNLKWSCTIT